MNPLSTLDSDRMPARTVVRRRGWKHAFTLVELLVVVALIGILATVIGFSMVGGSKGQALDSAQRNLLFMIQAAKTTAQLEKTRARFIIFAEDNQVAATNGLAPMINPKILRFYGVIYAASDDPTVKAGVMTGQPTLVYQQTAPYHIWLAANQGAMLPDDIYFLPAFASSYATDLPIWNTPTTNAVNGSAGYPQNPVAMDDHPGFTTGKMQVQFPVTAAADNNSTGDWYYFIEFAPDGYYFNQNGNNNLIIGQAYTNTDGTIDFRGTGASTPNLMYSGVQLRALGGASPFRSTQDFVPAGQ
jgi:prepilin-type N-terminal cleavage/methylation domain-containing protein